MNTIKEVWKSENKWGGGLLFDIFDSKADNKR